MTYKPISFDDDLVIVYADVDICEGEEIYRGLEDYEPMKDATWSWDSGNKCYRFRDADGRHYKKVCLDI